MANDKLCGEMHIASSEALFIRSKIIEYCKQDCFDLTPKQVDTVLELAKEYNKPSESTTNLSVKMDVEKVKILLEYLNALHNLKRDFGYNANESIAEVVGELRKEIKSRN